MLFRSPDTIDGKWYFDEASQKGEFTLGKVSTTGYENVTDSIPGQIIGSQTVTVKMDGKRLSGPPQHSHFLLHSEASQDTSQPRKGSGDFYIRGYKNTTGKIQNYTAIGGLSLTHTHVMSKRALTDTTVASYDIYNYTGGDSASGSIKEAGYYYASGGVGAGSYETVTTVAAPTFKKFNSSSVIGGRTVQIQGTPVYTYTETVYSNPGNFTFNMPSSWDSLAIAVAGGSGSGGVATVPGNTGGTSSVIVGNSTLLSMSSTGGGGGGAATANAGGAAGAAGSTSYSGTLMNATAQAAGNSITTINGAAATAGSGTTVYVASISGWTPSSGASLPSGTFVTGKGGVNYAKNTLTGSDGNYSYTLSQPTVGPTTYSSSSQNVSVGWSATAGKLKSLTWTIAGARGGNATGSPTYANGGPGNVLTLPYSDSALTSFTNGTSFTLYCGGVGNVNGGGSAQFGAGGNGGSPGGSGTYGAGGGGATSLTLNSNIIAGAGGGGGAGGYDPGYGDYGDSGNAGSLGLISTTSNLYGGAGKNGGNAGCNGGGGGGGGGGIDTNATGSSAGGGGGGAGHYGGYAGQRGYSAYKTTYFNTPTSNTDSNTGGGYGTVTYQTEESYYTPPAGGGGQTKVLSATILKAGATAVSASFSSLSITVGLGATGVNSGGYYSSAGSNGEVQITTGVITSYSGGQIITTVGDIVKSASDGVEIYDSGTGSGTSEIGRAHV